MSLINFIWSTIPAACLTLALIHGLIWWRRREALANGLFALMAVAVFCITTLHLAMMRSDSVSEYGQLLRWIHVPLFILVITQVWFVRVYLRAGRIWLAWLVCGLRAISLGLDFVFTPNLNFHVITGLIKVPFLGELVSAPEGVRNNWMLVGNISLILLAVFLADAAWTTWRRRDPARMRWLSTMLTVMAVVAIGQGMAVLWGYAHLHGVFNPFFPVVVVVMGVELSWDFVRISDLLDNLQASEGRFRTLLEGAPMGIIVARQGTVLYVNQSCKELLGLTHVQEWAGRPLVDYFAPESRAEILERVRRRKAGLPTDMNYEAVGLRVNGQSFPMHLTIAPISLPDGEAHIGFVMDITERKRAEEQLRRSEEKFRLMVEGMPLGLALVSRTDGRIIHINAKFTELFGYTIEDIRLETDWWARAYPEPAYREQLLAEMQKRTEWVKHDPTRQAVYDTRVTCKDGTEKIVEWGFIIMGDRRVIYGVDITGRRQAEALRDRLEAQNRQLHKAEGLGRMAGAIAHHFNNQLMTVMLNLDLARQDLATAQVAFDSVGNLEDAMQAARRLADMSQAMLTYLGYNQVQNEVLDFAEACQVPALLTFFRESLPKGVQLEMDCPSPGPKVFGNRNQFQQVTANLLANAAEAMGENAGKIHLNIRTCSKHVILAGRCFPVDFQPDAEVYACLEVIDVGVGIAAKDIENLFDPFYSSKLTGRGMGLAVVLGIARTHRGAITVASQVGRGSVFRVFVPIHEAERVLAG